MLPWCPASSSAPAAHERETRKRHRVTALVSVQLRQSQMWLLGSMKSKALLIWKRRAGTGPWLCLTHTFLWHFFFFYPWVIYFSTSSSALDGPYLCFSYIFISVLCGGLLIHFTWMSMSQDISHPASSLAFLYLNDFLQKMSGGWRAPYLTSLGDLIQK